MAARSSAVVPAPRQDIALPRYEEMCRAIAEAYQTDEVKEIRDKAMALEAYFRQAKNTEAERRACEIRLRAERKAGELSSQLERAQGRRTDIETSSNAETKSYEQQLADAGISRQQAHRWQQLAQVPDDQFEAALAAPKKPTTTGILAEAKPKQEPMNPRALWLWGRLRDFEREGLLHEAPAEVLHHMTDAMQADVRRLAPLVADWLGSID